MKIRDAKKIINSKRKGKRVREQRSIMEPSYYHRWLVSSRAGASPESHEPTWMAFCYYTNMKNRVWCYLIAWLSFRVYCCLSDEMEWIEISFCCWMTKLLRWALCDHRRATEIRLLLGLKQVLNTNSNASLPNYAIISVE